MVYRVVIGADATDKMRQHLGAEVDLLFVEALEELHYFWGEYVDGSISEISRRVGDLLMEAANDACRVDLDDSARTRVFGDKRHHRNVGLRRTLLIGTNE